MVIYVEYCVMCRPSSQILWVGVFWFDKVCKIGEHSERLNQPSSKPLQSQCILMYIVYILCEDDSNY